ncbi:MAG TPA: hypothetical protein VGF30_02810 [Bacteroidia bacterium]
MKKFIVLIIAVLGSSLVIAQKPAYPSKEQVLKDAKNNYTLSGITQIYTAPLTWDKIKLEYKMYVNGNELVESSYYDYQSTLAKKGDLDYNDMTSVYVLATTPKNSEGKYYEITIEVRYTRYGGVISASKWSYKECNIGSNAYTQKGGSAAADAKRLNQVIDLMKKYKGDKNTPKEPTNFYITRYDEDFVKIDSICLDKEQQDKNLTYQRFHYYKIKGLMVKRDGNKRTYYANSSADMYIEWELKEGEKEWKPVTVAIERFTPSDTKVSAKALGITGNQELKSFEAFGFEDIYKKTAISERNLYTEADLKDFGEKIEKTLKLIYTNPEEGKKQLEELVDPLAPGKQEIIDSYYTPIVSAKKFMCTYGENSFVSVSAWITEEDNKKKLHIERIVSDVDFKREGTEDKTLLKAYKEAGISKETLKTTWGGRYDEAWRVEISPVFKNNQWYIGNVATPPKKFD